MQTPIYPKIVICCLVGATLFISQKDASADICKWVDEHGVTHYAENCPENIEVERIEIRPPPSEEQVIAAKERLEAMRKGRLVHEASSGKRIKFRSQSLAELGPLPVNESSEHLITKGTGITFNARRKDGQFNLSLEPRGLPGGTVLETQFPDPADPTRKIAVEEILHEDETEKLVISPSLPGFKCWNYEVEVFIYSDDTKSELLGNHYQTIQSRVDLRSVKDNMDLISAMQGSNCPSRERDASASNSSLDFKCPTAYRVKKTKKMAIECDQARRKIIEPMRDMEIEKCINNGKKSPEQCKRYYENFLELNTPPSSGVVFGLRPYDDLPECQIYYRCRGA